MRALRTMGSVTVLAALLACGGDEGGFGSQSAHAFAISVQPETVEVPQGGSVVVEVRVDRRPGIGAVTIDLDPPHPGIVAEPLAIEAAASAGRLRISASMEVAPGTRRADVRARAGDQEARAMLRIDVIEASQR